MKKIISILISLLLLASAFGVTSIFGATGGPDAFGYTYDDRIQYQWIDISGTGLTDPKLENDDDGVIVPIGFNFRFYGNSTMK